jgi:hypothetical protein
MKSSSNCWAKLLVVLLFHQQELDLEIFELHEFLPGSQNCKKWLPSLYDLRTLRFEFPASFRKQKSSQSNSSWAVFELSSAAKPTSKTARYAANQSRSALPQKMTNSSASIPRTSAKTSLDCMRAYWTYRLKIRFNRKVRYVFLPDRFGNGAPIELLLSPSSSALSYPALGHRISWVHHVHHFCIGEVRLISGGR